MVGRKAYLPHRTDMALQRLARALVLDGYPNAQIAIVDGEARRLLITNDEDERYYHAENGAFYEYFEIGQEVER